MKSALVIGGGSHLGKRIVNKFVTSNPIWKVFNVDNKKNEEASDNFLFDSDFTKLYSPDLRRNINGKFDCIINATSSCSKSELNNDRVVEYLHKTNNKDMNSSILAAFLAKKYLNESGLLVLMGSENYKLKTNSNFIVDNITKESVNYFTELLVNNPSELPEDTKLITLMMYFFNFF